MNKKSKSILAILLIVMLIIIAIVCFNVFFKKNEKQPINADMNQTVQQEKNKISELKKIKDYEIFNANVSVVSGITNFKAYIRNISNETKQNKNFDIQILGENEEILATVTVHIEKLEPGGIKQVSSEIWKGIQNAKDYRIIEK